MDRGVYELIKSLGSPCKLAVLIVMASTPSRDFPLRFNQLVEMLDPFPRSTISTTLKALEEDGYIVKIDLKLDRISPLYGYTLTLRGHRYCYPVASAFRA